MPRGVPSQEAENGEKLALTSLFVPFIQIRMQYRKWTVWGGLSILLKLINIVFHRFAQEPVSQGILAPNMLTVEIDHYPKNLPISHLFCIIR